MGFNKPVVFPMRKSCHHLEYVAGPDPGDWTRFVLPSFVFSFLFNALFSLTLPCPDSPSEA
jgi:hypothetical protein